MQSAAFTVSTWYTITCCTGGLKVIVHCFEVSLCGPTGTSANGVYGVGTGRPTVTTVSKGYSVSPGRPTGTTVSEGYSVSPGRPTGTTVSEGHSHSLQLSEMEIRNRPHPPINYYPHAHEYH